MKIGIFTDTYFPQVSGVASSIRTLKDMLESMGNEVYIFTTTDPNATDQDDPSIIRLPSVPFISFSDRRIVMRGMINAYNLAKEHDLDIVHTQTEFGVGILGKFVANKLGIPVIHTLHTKYEDYVHYIAKGMLIHPGVIKYFMRGYLHKLDGMICPSQMVYDTVLNYGVKIPKRVIPTGIELGKFEHPEITKNITDAVRTSLGITEDEVMLLSLSRISYEKNIQEVIKSMPDIIKKTPAKLVVVGDGPYRKDLQKLVKELSLEDYVQFTGMVNADDTAIYYKAADFFVSASTSETQGLTYIESMASATPIIATNNPYLADLVSDKMFGTLFNDDDKLSDVILEAISSTPPMEQSMLNEKLYEISAENFGRRVYEFYIDMIISHKFNSKEDSISDIVIKKPLTMVKSVGKKYTDSSTYRFRKDKTKDELDENKLDES